MTRRPRLPNRVVLAFYLVMGGGSYLIAVLFLDIDPFRPFPERANRPLLDLALGAGMGGVVVLASFLLDRWFAWSRALTQRFREVLGYLRPADALVIALASGLGEEILFRGVLLPWLGLVPSSLIFGLVHGVSPGKIEEMIRVMRQFAPLVVIATLLGFAFGVAVEYTGSILVAVVAHFTINYLNLSAMYRKRWQSEGSEGDNG
ncbi:MAG: CPBP family intramembrane metalloprotease [Bradymonadales bacterium]|nr:CPBP family intramembrane metalloprotease [Bradymonadales bacterium]